MRLIRSWPAQVPAGRSHVVDDLERLVIDDHDYRGLAELDDDVLLLEWDIAAGREDLLTFASCAARAPDSVLAAPYRLYAASAVYADLVPGDDEWTWCAGHWDGAKAYGHPFGVTPAEDGDPTCDLFGFGMVYLPRALIARFLATDPARFDDVSFATWHAQHVGPAALCWDARPVHLHYDAPVLTPN